MLVFHFLTLNSRFLHNTPPNPMNTLHFEPMGLLEVIGPVMVGPSSSHTAGACRLALLARHTLLTEPHRATLTLHGSFAKTAKGHGTDRALAGGLLGYAPDDARIPDALERAETSGPRALL